MWCCQIQHGRWRVLQLLIGKPRQGGAGRTGGSAARLGKHGKLAESEARQVNDERVIRIARQREALWRSYARQVSTALARVWVFVAPRMPLSRAGLVMHSRSSFGNTVVLATDIMPTPFLKHCTTLKDWELGGDLVSRPGKAVSTKQESSAA